jgi:hypothetical protein
VSADQLIDWLRQQAADGVELLRAGVAGAQSGGLDGFAHAIGTSVPLVILAIVFVANLVGGEQ